MTVARYFRVRSLLTSLHHLGKLLVHFAEDLLKKNDPSITRKHLHTRVLAKISAPIANIHSSQIVALQFIQVIHLI